MAVIEVLSDEEDQLQEEGDALGQEVLVGITDLQIAKSFSEEGEEDEDDEDREDDVWVGGLRGFVQTAEEPWKLLRQYFPSKAGGAPAWLDPTNLPKGKKTICGICEKPLQFVLQVYAPPGEDEAAFHRTLFVFICTSLACLQQDELQQSKKEKRRRSVKVFRSQLPRNSPYYSSNPPSISGDEPALSESVPLCTWCGTWKGSKICGGCRQTRYCSQTHQMDHWRGGHAPSCREVQEKLKSASSDTSGESVTTISRTDAETLTKAQCTSLWPEFELIVDDSVDYDEDDEDSDDNLNARSGAGRLLADYERRRAQGKEDIPDFEDSPLDEQHWAFFQAKISKSPEQVLWYFRSGDAKPLWPRLKGQPTESHIPDCSLCGGERTFEFQILPQLLYFFQVKDDPDSLDWGTIAVYSCAQSCKIEGYCEEFAWVQPGFT